MNFLAEWYLPDLTEAAVDDIVTRLHAAASALTGEAAPVRLVATLSVPTDEVLYVVFDADSPESVVATCERAGIPQHRLSAGVVPRWLSQTPDKRLLPGVGGPEDETAERLVAH